MKFILTLHCETDWNDPRTGKLQGHTDIALNDLGKKNARELAVKIRMSNLSATQIISSDLLRASETAEIISANLGISIKFGPCFRECKFGSLEGLLKSELLNRYFPTTQEVAGLWHGSFKNYDFTQYVQDDQ